MPDKTGKLKHQRNVDLPRNVYMHDFFVSENYIIFNLHPALVDFGPVLAGKRSMVGSMNWHSTLGNMIMIIEREGDKPPILLETNAIWMWHSFNAYEKKDEIICDFIGYDVPDHFLGKNPVTFSVMKNEAGEAEYPGKYRRYIINLKNRKIKTEIIFSDNSDFPMIDPRKMCYPFRYGYSTFSRNKGIFHPGIVRLDSIMGKAESYSFEEGCYCGEPIFAYNRHLHTERDNGIGWILTLVYDGNKNKTFLAVFLAEAISKGPVAKLHLEEATPLGFHGFWKPDPSFQD